MHSRAPLRAIAIGLLLAACDSSTGSDPLSGIYVAQTANGRPVPAALDTAHWNDGSTFTVFRLMAASVEFLDRENARYTTRERDVAYMGADSLYNERCRTVTLPYRQENGRVLLVVEPALFGEAGRLRLDTLVVQNATLVQTVRSATGKSVRLEYAAVPQPVWC